MLVSSTSVFRGVEPFPVGLEPEVWPEGLLPRVSDGDALEDMVGLNSGEGWLGEPSRLKESMALFRYRYSL